MRICEGLQSTNSPTWFKNLSMLQIQGHERERGLLRNAVLKDRLPHALLFSGPNAVGKRLVALELARDILGKIEGHPDLHLLERDPEKKDISIEQVRELISALQLRPYFGGKRFAIIDDAHLLSLPAQNALLLTLEEPPEDAILILISHLPHRLLPTILSRTQEVSFGPLSSSALRLILGHLAGIENTPLIPYLNGSLESLDLSRTGLWVTPSEKINGQLAEFEEELKKLSGLIKRGLMRVSLGESLSIASELAAFDHERVFRTLLPILSRQLREDSSCADTLLRAVEVERLIAQRNLNPTTQISTLLALDS